MRQQVTSIPAPMRPKDTIKFLTKTIEAGMSTLLVGRPGIGKSDIVDQVRLLLDYDFYISHPVVDDPTDHKGFPVYVNGTAIFVEFPLLKAMIEATKPTIVFYDDLGQALPAVQAAIMQIILAREINGKKISDHVRFVAATNRGKDGAGVTGFLEPLKSRFCIIHLEPTVEDWTEWAMTKPHIPAELIGAVNYKPKWITQWEKSREIENTPTPRNISECGKLIAMFKDESIGFQRSAYASRIGSGAASELIEYLNLCKKLPSYQQVLADPDSVPVPSENSGVKYTVVAALASKVDNADDFATIGRYIDKFPGAFRSLYVTAVTNRVPELRESSYYIDWAVKAA